jgi:membrane fusion protein, multidrug efflux system
MASKAIYSAVAVVGIALASGAAYWFQNKPKGPQEITASGAPAPAGTASGVASGGAGGRGPSGPAGVEVAKVELTRLQDDAQSVGTLRSRQNVLLRPEVAGRVQSMGFTDGGRVRKGDILVQLDDVLQRAEVRQAEAQVSIARANLKRNQDLVAQNFVAQRVLDESAANVQVVEAQMALACARWERMRIVAPFDGTAGIRSINLGDYVKDGADMVNIEDLSSMYVDFRLPERFQGKLRRDQPVELQLDAMPGRTFKAKIEAIDPQIDANGRSVAVRAVMPNSNGEPLVQRAAGGPAAGASAPMAGASAAAGAKPADTKPAGGARAAGKPAARSGAAASGGTAGAPRATDTIAAACAVNSASARSVSGAGTPSARAAVASAGTSQGANRSVSVPAAGVAGESAGAKAGGASKAAANARSGGSGGAGGPLRPGMFARVTTVFNVKEKSLTVPEEAIVPQGGKQYVIKVVAQTEEQAKALADAAQASAAAAAASAAASGASAPAPSPAAAPPVFVDGKRLVSQRTEVKIGIRRAGRVELTEGVDDGDTVVVAGQQRLLRDNTPVRVVDLGRPQGQTTVAGPVNAASAAAGGAPVSMPANTPAGVPSATPQNTATAPPMAPASVVLK